MSQTKLIETKYLIIQKNQSGSNSTYTIREKNGKTINFTLQAAASGCGLVILGSWIYIQPYLADKETRNHFLEIIKAECLINKWFCIIATLGDNYTTGTNKEKYEPLLLGMGFKEIHRFENKNYPNEYKQRIYQCSLNDLK